MRWIRKQGTSLKSHYLVPIDNARKRAESGFYFKLYFKLLGKKIEEYKIKRHNRYNIDEKGFLVSMLIRVKRVFSKAVFKLGKIKNII